MKKILLLSFLIAALAACGDDTDSSTTGTNTSSPTVGGAPASGSSSGGNLGSSSGASANPESSDSEPVPEDDAGQQNFFYFSYDDSSSTAARDLSIFAIANGNQPQQSWGRPYEFLNAETYGHFAKQQAGPFQVSIGAYLAEADELSLPKDVTAEQVMALGVNISGPTMSKAQRDNVVLTLLVDISGSMSSNYASEVRSDLQSLMDVTKHALNFLPQSLKEGDELNLVSFNQQGHVLLEGWQFGDSGWQEKINQLAAEGSTNLNAGIETAYQVASRRFDSSKSNRVIILTDAYANTGEIDASKISKHTVINGLEGIYFAGVGIGDGFNDAFLNELTEAGKGVYSAMITPTDGERIFTDGFMRFIDTAVKDVKFKLEFPNGLEHLVSAAEQVSQDKDQVQSTHFAFNSEQFFFELFNANSEYDDSLSLTLEIEYKNDQNELVTERVESNISDLLAKGESEIKAAAMTTSLAYLISGKLTCQQVQSSGLYQQEISGELFSQYKQRINSFCTL